MKHHSIALVFSILMLGCDGSSTQDGGIVVPDGARPDDAGADAGPEGGSDAGADGGIYCASTRSDPSYWPRLPESCLPRCTRETGEAISHCTTIDCQERAFNMDPTPPVVLDTVYGDIVVSCGGENDGTHFECYVFQRLSCDADICRDQYYALVTCTSACDDETAALLACREDGTAWTSCNAERGMQCFAP